MNLRKTSDGRLYTTYWVTFPNCPFDWIRFPIRVYSQTFERGDWITLNSQGTIEISDVKQLRELN